MQSMILLAVGAVWLAVIVPPLLRSRVENRPNSSITDFRRQLSTLQRTVPTRSMAPMRTMARPLTQAPHQRTQVHAPVAHHGDLRRAVATDLRPHAPHRQAHLQRVSQREMMRRRRANVLYILMCAVALTGFLAATAGGTFMVYAFVVSFVSLCGYCYKLVQLRNVELDRTYGDQVWFPAG